MTIETKEEICISVTDMVKIFDDNVTAVDGLNLEVKKGELYGFLGPNGAGKTTTLNILCGLLKPTSGVAIIGGYDVSKQADEIKAIIGVCPQEPATYGFLSGRKNIEFFGNLHCVPKKILKERTQTLLDALNLTEDADRTVKTYSGGMIRRINTAIALISEPEIVFLDEPTVAMDPQSRRAVWAFIDELREKGKTIILTTHYIEEAEALCDRVGIIDQGKLIELGTPKGLKKKYDAKTLEDVFIQITGRRLQEAI
ncbi:Trehalose/maltose import ATP-binding protein MalK [Candidatus Lokiarchaeum ossiferum]|uniref:Trehalose/maltose import ATP-binding protein MalK n=1 Tax=Candidatus Lokiarchaeum ossiferum TaxID=2951803 RepID=A0ABY6HPG2_9ARCH|nr:Trehalose/maltose import ATP-binding protein MalK [Candidatus Lokiarchaeum sp. B-35]